MIICSVTTERSSAPDSSSGGRVVRMCVGIRAMPVAALVSLSKTLDHKLLLFRIINGASVWAGMVIVFD